MSENQRALAIRVSGRVQGVNYRSFTKTEATRLGVRGWVRNCEDGSVEAALQGSGAALAELIELCRKGPSEGEVEGLEVRSADHGLVGEPPEDAYRF